MSIIMVNHYSPSAKLLSSPRLSLGWESVVLFLICTGDMLSTLYWIHTHAATESNPWMALWLQHGDLAFCAVKMLSFVPFLIVAAYYRPRRPRLIRVSLRGTIALYALVYAVSVGSQFITL